MEKSQWFSGFLWAESIFKLKGPMDGEHLVINAVDDAKCFGTVTEFDNGAMDYTSYYRTRLGPVMVASQ